RMVLERDEVQPGSLGDDGLLDGVVHRPARGGHEGTEQQIVSVVVHAVLLTGVGAAMRLKLSRNRLAGSNRALSAFSRTSVSGGNASASRSGLVSVSKLR